MKSPRRWTPEQLKQDALQATINFRHERLDEPREVYTEQYEKYHVYCERLVERLADLHAAEFDLETLVEIMADEGSRRAFCYLTAPPISEDDLKTLAEASLTRGGMRRDPESAARIQDVIFRVIDPHRFPWVVERRDPTPAERHSAVVATAALIATRKVETFRRTDAKDRQEGKVKQLLRELGFDEVAKRSIPTANAGPAAGEFMGETPLAGAKADVVAGLRDGRLLAIECKVSNSSVNSYKRIVHDTGGKATIWYEELGRRNVVASAVLNGVFAPANLELVQNDKHVFLFWDHRLDDLTSFVEAAC